MLQWLNKYSEFEHTSQANEKGIRANDYQVKPNTTKWLAEST